MENKGSRISKTGSRIANKGSRIAMRFMALFMAATAVTIASETVHASGQNNHDSVAVLIGNKTYMRSHVPPVSFARNDVAAMRAFLIQKLGYRDENIIVLENATLARMQEVFGNEEDETGLLIKIVKKHKSNVFMYYSGHGVPVDGKPYLIPVDVDTYSARFGYSLEVLQRNIARVTKKIGPDRHVILILDACFTGVSGDGKSLTGSSAGGVIPVMPKPVSSIVRVAASGPKERAYWDNAAGHGLFTHEFIEAVSGEADNPPFGNGDGYVSWGEVAKFVRQRVAGIAKRRAAHQRPEFPTTAKINWRIAPGRLLYDRESNVKRAYEEALAKNTVEGWSGFLKTYPHAPSTEAARRKWHRAIAARKAYEKAKRRNTARAWERFLDRFPESHYADEAEDMLEKLYEAKAARRAYRTAEARDTIADWEAFLLEYPDSPPYSEKARREKERLERRIAGSAASELKSAPDGGAAGIMGSPPPIAPPVTPPAGGACGPGYETYKGTDFTYNDIGGGFSYTTLSQCVALCNRTRGCNALSFIYKAGIRKRCWIKYRASNRKSVWFVTSCVRTSAAPSGYGARPAPAPRRSYGACGSGYRTLSGIDYTYNDIAGYRASFAQCRRLCSRMGRCRAFAFITKRVRQNCWLKYALGRGRSVRYVVTCVKQ